MKWFRLYDEILDDPKMMELSAKEFQTWILLLCLANREDHCKRGELPCNFATIVRNIHGNFRTIFPILKRFIELGLIKQNGNSIQIVNWDKRQFKSDDILQRVKRYRNVTRNVTASVSVLSNLDISSIKKKELSTEKYISPYLGEFGNIKITEEQMKKLKDQFGEDDTTKRIENLSVYIASKGKKYKNHYATILSWARKEGYGNKKVHSRPSNLFLDPLTEEIE